MTVVSTSVTVAEQPQEMASDVRTAILITPKRITSVTVLTDSQTDHLSSCISVRLFCLFYNLGQSSVGVGRAKSRATHSGELALQRRHTHELTNTK